MYQNYKNLPQSYIMGTLIRRREDPEYATEMLNEIGTTDMVIGDPTAEVMITTIGKIPNEMYDLEETSIHSVIAGAEGQHKTVVMDEKNSDSSSGFGAHSTLFTILMIALLALLLLCCVAACIIARARRRCLDSSDLECDPECRGSKEPLISSDKLSETTSKSTGVSTRN